MGKRNQKRKNGKDNGGGNEKKHPRLKRHKHNYKKRQRFWVEQCKGKHKAPKTCPSEYIFPVTISRVDLTDQHTHSGVRVTCSTEEKRKLQHTRTSVEDDKDGDDDDTLNPHDVVRVRVLDDDPVVDKDYKDSNDSKEKSSCPEKAVVDTAHASKNGVVMSHKAQTEEIAFGNEQDGAKESNDRASVEHKEAIPATATATATQTKPETDSTTHITTQTQQDPSIWKPTTTSTNEQDNHETQEKPSGTPTPTYNVDNPFIQITLDESAKGKLPVRPHM